jgi:hypothetical protein
MVRLFSKLRGKILKGIQTVYKVEQATVYRVKAA